MQDATRSQSANNSQRCYLRRMLSNSAGVIFMTALAMNSYAASPAYTITDLGTLGGLDSFGMAINSSGVVAGWSDVYFSFDISQAFLYDGTMHDLGSLSPNGNSGALGINDNGVIVGGSNFNYTTDGHAFIYDGSMHDLGGLGGRESVATGINNLGQIIGSYYPGFGPHAFLYDGTKHDLGSLGGSTSEANAINNHTEVTGTARINPDSVPGISHAFLYDGTMHDLGTLGGDQSVGNGINDQGWVVGQSDISGNSAHHAFLYNGTLSDLGTLGGPDSIAYGINNGGQIVGQASINDESVGLAFIYTVQDGMVDLNSLIAPDSDWTLLSANAINDAGQIVGFGGIGFEDHAFLLTPVPEPSALTLAALTAVGLLVGRRKSPIRIC